MRIKFYFSLLLILTFCFSAPVFAQKKTSEESQKKLQKDSLKSPRIISGGIVNGKALSLVKPPFPKSARIVGAEGMVDVRVTIDENGDIISAEAVSGHPLLRSAALQAARASKFLPTMMDGLPVRVTGIIIYNFFTDMSFLEIGYELSFAENSATFSEKFPVYNITGNLPAEWKAEREDLNLLSSYLFAQKRSAEKSENPELKNRTEKSDSSTDRFMPGRTEGLSASAIIKPDEILKELNVKIDNRLRNEELKSWYFKLGQILGKISAEIEDSNETLANIDELNKHVIDLPLNVSMTVVTKARKIGAFFDESALDSERKQQLTAFVRNLKESPFAQ